MVCINMMIRKILILRVCWWPYLAVCDVTCMSMKMVIGMMRVGGVEGIGGSCLWVGFIVVMNGKDWNHLLVVVAVRTSIPLGLMSVGLCIHGFAALVEVLLRVWIGLTKHSERVGVWFGCLAWRSSIWRRWGCQIIRCLIITRPPHKHSLPMQNLIVRSVGRRRVFHLWLNRKNFRGGRVRVMPRSDDTFMGWWCSIGRAFGSFVLHMRILDDLIERISLDNWRGTLSLEQLC